MWIVSQLQDINPLEHIWEILHRCVQQHSIKHQMREYVLGKSCSIAPIILKVNSGPTPYWDTLCLFFLSFVNHLYMYIKHRLMHTFENCDKINQFNLLAPEKIQSQNQTLCKVWPLQAHWSFKGPLSKINWKQSTSELAHWPDLANNRPWAKS